MATVEKARPTEQDATKTPGELFKFSAWVHVGLGSDECSKATTGDCADSAHFHAWCRVPNQMQHDDIRERALGAKARRIRQLRDPETDAHQVLEADIDELRRNADRDVLVDELLTRDWWKRQLDAMRDVDERDEFKTMRVDRERVVELRMSETASEDEIAELDRHIAAYTQALVARRDELTEPVRAALEALGVDELLNQVREDRITADAGAQFMDAYSHWEWLAGVYVDSDPATRKRSFSDMQQLAEAAPEVLDALRATFTELEASMQRGPTGN